MTEITRKYNVDADTMFQRTRLACVQAGLSITKEDLLTRRIQASTGLSSFSWGERVNILVSQQIDGSTVTIESKPKVMFNLTAFGGAKGNVETLFERIEGTR
jgi:hypothetical protein